MCFRFFLFLSKMGIIVPISGLCFQDRWTLVKSISFCLTRLKARELMVISVIIIIKTGLPHGWETTETRSAEQSQRYREKKQWGEWQSSHQQVDGIRELWDTADRNVNGHNPFQTPLGSVCKHPDLAIPFLDISSHKCTSLWTQEHVYSIIILIAKKLETTQK